VSANDCVIDVARAIGLYFAQSGVAGDEIAVRVKAAERRGKPLYMRLKYMNVVLP
jgi:hypothetical protein